MDFSLRLAIFDVLMTSLDDGGVRLETLGFDPLNYRLFDGSHRFSRDFFLTADISSLGPVGLKRAFLAYCFNYLLSLSLSVAVETEVTPLELLAVVDATFGVLRNSQFEDYDPYEVMRRDKWNHQGRRKKRRPPDFRALTVLSW